MQCTVPGQSILLTLTNVHGRKFSSLLLQPWLLSQAQIPLWLPAWNSASALHLTLPGKHCLHAPLPTAKSQSLPTFSQVSLVTIFLLCSKSFSSLGYVDSLPKIQAQFGPNLTQLFDFISLHYQQWISRTVLGTL